jgi:hypothetical protein
MGAFGATRAVHPGLALTGRSGDNDRGRDPQEVTVAFIGGVFAGTILNHFHCGTAATSITTGRSSSSRYRNSASYPIDLATKCTSHCSGVSCESTIDAVGMLLVSWCSRAALSTSPSEIRSHTCAPFCPIGVPYDKYRAATEYKLRGSGSIPRLHILSPGPADGSLACPEHQVAKH